MPVIEVKLGDPDRLPTDETVKFLDDGLGPKPRTMNEAFLVALVKMLEPKIAVEVGILYAETTACLAAALRPGAMLYALDINVERSMAVLDAWDILLGLRSRIVVLEGDSGENAKLVPDGIGFAFVDGDHSVEGVERDIEAFWPKMAANGIMAFHDVNDEKIGVIETVSRRFPDALYLPWHQGLVLAQKGPKTIITRQRGIRIPWGEAVALDTARRMPG